MKKLMFLMFIGMALFAVKAKAQTCDSTVTIDGSGGEYGPGANNLDTFTWHVTADGYINYTLTDNGPGGSTMDYESGMYIAWGYGFGGPYNTMSRGYAGGGSFSGTLNIGAVNQYVYVEHDCGWIYGDHDYTTSEYWGDYIITFNNNYNYNADLAKTNQKKETKNLKE